MRIGTPLPKFTAKTPINTERLIPQYHIKVRTPDTGWQVVSTAWTLKDALKISTMWKRKTRYCMSVDVLKIAYRMSNTWACVAQFEPKTKGEQS